MEAIGDFIPVRATRPGPRMPSERPRLISLLPESAELDAVLARLRVLSATAASDAALFGASEASDFAGQVEEVSRTVEYFQLIAAAAVDRTRIQAATAGKSSGAVAAAGWQTGWHTAASAEASSEASTGQENSPSNAAAPESAGDGYRNTTEFLRARVRISAAEARRRLALAAAVLPRTGIAGQPRPAVREELAAVVASVTIASRAATIVTLSLDRVEHASAPEQAARMEHALTLTAVENDQDFLTRVAKHWTDALDQDGAEPDERELRHRQGVFIRPTRRGLHHLEIFATTDQFEPLLTVMNVATNPRNGQASRPDADTDAAGNTPTQAAADVDVDVDADAADAVEQLDQRTRPQKLLDGLVGACKGALATGNLPAAGGLRPQVMVTIDYRDLLERLGGAATEANGPGSSTGTLMFTGPITASTVRKIACDADVIPVLLGGEGRILDIGRASRVFPPHIRKALTARDRGCAFPQCTIPAAWCEAHHITYWSRGGNTGSGNGALLCSHHHHVIHKEQWTIQLRSGVPWFIPPPHLDPHQEPRRNHYFRLE